MEILLYLIHQTSNYEKCEMRPQYKLTTSNDEHCKIEFLKRKKKSVQTKKIYSNIEMIIEKTKFRALNESDPQVVDKERGHGLQKKKYDG